MKKNVLAVVALALLLVALIAGCRRAKPPVVSDVQVESTAVTTVTTAATAPAGGAVTVTATPSPTSESTPEITSTPTVEAVTPTPTTAAETTPTVTPSSTPVPTTVPTTAPTTVPTSVSTEAVSGERTHVVQPGENLFRIALKYGVAVEAIAVANDISNVNFIYPGQKLVIP